MATDRSPAAEHHVSGLYVTMLMDSLAASLQREEIEALLIRAGETRTLEELATTSSWSSYEQFKRLLQCAPPALDGNSSASTVTLESELAGTIQALGSPASVLATNTGINPLLPIRRYETTEIGPNEWTISEWFIDGFAPFPEFCRFVAKQYAMIPMFFGLPEAEVTEETCQCRGDLACLFRMRWADLDKDTSRAEYLEVRGKQLESRLEQLEEMITDLASNERYEDVLQGIVSSTTAAVFATGALLAIEPRMDRPRRLYFEGLTDTEASELADDLLKGGLAQRKVVAVEVTSVRRHYGVLAIGEHGGLFASHMQTALKTNARLAAATLDAAEALEDARHQAKTAQTLLDLSTSLASNVSSDEMASRVVRAVPSVIDCDRVALILDDGSWEDVSSRGFRIAASHGYPADVAATISDRIFSESEVGEIADHDLLVHTYSFPTTTATVSAPITVAGTTIGFIAVSVMSEPNRLAINSRLADRLKGLAAQAAIAISNARSLDQIRYQAVHDTLTGLPNRSLILDRIEKMLARARRSEAPVAALFIDLDGFKEVNDTLGHAVGDQLLQMVADRLSNTLREGDSIGRLGGDEFIVLVDGTSPDATPEVVGERLLEELRAPFDLKDSSGCKLTLTASIGIAAGFRPSATELLRDADVALYRAKSMGKDCLVAFGPEIHDLPEDHSLLLEGSIQHQI